MVEKLSGMFNAILGGNVYNVLLHVNAATLRGLTSFILCLIKCSFRTITFNSVTLKNADRTSKKNSTKQIIFRVGG